MRNLITAEMAELLIALAQDSNLWAQDNNATSDEAEQAYAIAAEIQEVLEEEKRLVAEYRAAEAMIWEVKWLTEGPE